MVTKAYTMVTNDRGPNRDGLVTFVSTFAAFVS